MTGFKKIGENVKIWPMAKVVQREVISIGDNVIIDDFAFIVGGRKTEIGNYVHIASFTCFTGGGELILGDFTSYGAGTKLVTGSEYFKGECLTNPTVPAPYRVPKRSFIRIGKHSILGSGITVMPGVTVGEGCAIGACSLVLKDCDPWTIYAGIPAKPIGRRPSEKIFELEEELRGKTTTYYQPPAHFAPYDYEKR